MKKSLQFQIYEAMANKLMPYKLKYLTKISLEITERHNFMVFSNDFCKHFKKVQLWYFIRIPSYEKSLTLTKIYTVKYVFV